MDWNVAIQSLDTVFFLTPLVGVWIEISKSLGWRACLWHHSPCGSVDWNKTHNMMLTGNLLTPLVGVWIEILSTHGSFPLSISLPLWECGLKSQKKRKSLMKNCHSPCGSVDWNYWCYEQVDLLCSLPLWECGLKLWVNQAYWNVRRSLPLWECGLKSELNTTIKKIAFVTPLVGVWIEMTNCLQGQQDS